MIEIPYNEFDPEVVNLCKAMNRIKGICTHDSCSGHNKIPFRIFFGATNIDKSHQGLAVFLYYLDS